MRKPVVGVVGYFLDARVAAERGFGERDLAIYALNYFQKVLEFGMVPLGIPTVDPRHAADYLDSVDGVLLTGGSDLDPAFYGEEPHAKLGAVLRERDDFELELARLAMGDSTPVLGVCRGLQVVNVALGGSLKQHLEPGPEIRHGTGSPIPEFHPIDVADSEYAERMGPRPRVNSLHHQALDRVASDLTVLARAGDGVVEMVSSRTVPLLAVQWHPEQLASGDPAADVPFQWFAEQLQREENKRK